MANQNAPRGFIPLDLKPQDCRLYYKSASVILGMFDPVVRAADSTDPNGYAAVTRATTGSYITGVVVGIVPSPDRSYKYLKAADTGYLLVADNPDLLFQVQDNGGATGIVITNLGQSVDSVTALDCNATTGVSKFQLDTEAIAADNTWSLVRKDDMPGNTVGAYCTWVVKANLHTEVNAGVTNIKEI